MAEVLVQFSDTLAAPDGKLYLARACGAEMPDGMWQGWVEFLPVSDARPLRTGRETTQPNRQSTVYWATGLTGVYLEGALRRALNPHVREPEPEIPPPVFDEPADLYPPAAHTPESVLNPFAVYRHGEAHLRGQLSALSGWHLANIIRDYGLSDRTAAELDTLPDPALIDIIVSAVRAAGMVRTGDE